MKSPWESDYRNRGDEFDHHRFSERSTSAPPPETSLLFGRNEQIAGANSYLGPGLSDGNKLNNFYGNGHHGDAAGSLFLNSGNDNREKSGLSNSFEAAPPGFSSDLFSSGADSLSSSSAQRHYNGRNTNSYLGSLDRKTIGDNIVRSHSAAPSLDGRLSLGPPPGLGGGSRETPLTSNRSSDSYLESTLDSSHIVQLQQQRPASTGVIGGHQSSSSAVLDSLGLGSRSNGAVRPVAKGLMDLIQEDFPPESPIDPADLYGNNYPTTGSREVAYLERGPLERPRTTSPLSQPISRDAASYLYRNRDEPVFRHGNGSHTTESVNRFPFSTRSDHAQPQPTPQYTTVSDHGETNRPKGSIYAPIPQQSRPQPMRPQQQQNFDMQQQGYNAPAPVQTHVQTQPVQTHVQNQPVQHQPHVQNHPVPTHLQNQQLQSPHVQTHSGFNAPAPVQAQHLQAQVLPNGQTIYVNAPPPQYHGYTTVQYHPHGQQHHIVHQQIPGTMGGPPGSEQQQYISVVPIQNPGGAVQGIGPGGTYAYWQPDGQHGIPQTLTIVNPHGPGGVPVAVARVGNAPAESPRRPQSNNSQGSGGGSGGRGGKEKSSGKGRRSGGGQTQSSSSRRGGGGGGGGGESSKTPTNPSGSPLLEEFKAKKSRDWKMYEIKGHVVEFCQDQNGSRFIQQRLEVGDDGEKEVVMNEVLPAIRRLRNDVFGNYVVQKLLDFGTPKMKSDIRDTLQGEMLPLSLQMYGCRVVQKALETLDETDLPPLLKEFHSNVLSCIHDQNGNHVIQKCIEVMSDKSREARDNGENSTADFFNEQIDFIVDDVLDNVTSLSCHPYGCRVLQRILEHCVEPKKSRALDEISKCHRTLLDDQYGNYVIQHVLQFGRLEDRDSILEIVVENGLLLMSRQKFASNVVEKLLKYGNAQQRKAVVREMLNIVDEKTGELLPEGEEEYGASVVLLMVRDAYANYVVQTTLDVISECEEKRALLEELNAHATELKTYTFAKHIVTKLGA